MHRTLICHARMRAACPHMHMHIHMSVIACVFARAEQEDTCRLKETSRQRDKQPDVYSLGTSHVQFSEQNQANEQRL